MIKVPWSAPAGLEYLVALRKGQEGHRAAVIAKALEEDVEGRQQLPAYLWLHGLAYHGGDIGAEPLSFGQQLSRLDRHHQGDLLPDGGCVIDTLTSARIVLGNRQAKAAGTAPPTIWRRPPPTPRRSWRGGICTNCWFYAAMRNPPDDSSSRPNG